MKSAILITYEKDDAVNEAIALCEAAGYQISHIIKQKFLKRREFGMSAEIIDELDKITKKLKPDVIIFDEILKPSQNYNLASKLHRNILDREALILEIFESRATSSESKLQVKLAQLRYEMSRARERVRLAKIGEQPGFLGIGKFEVDVYYNDIKHRMYSVRSKLSQAVKQRELHRQSRKRFGFQTISLSGYTSAGKTTLFNLLTGEKKELNAKLFTTLSTTTRKMFVDKKPILISDTVGFISKLPAYVIEAFKSTLEELVHTDIVLVVIDVTDSLFELKKKFQTCVSTLNGIGVSRDKIIFVLNKSDLLTLDEIYEKAEYLDLTETKKWIYVSSVSAQNIQELKKLIGKILAKHEPIHKKVKKMEFSEIYEN